MTIRKLIDELKKKEKLLGKDTRVMINLRNKGGDFDLFEIFGPIKEKTIRKEKVLILDEI